MYIFFHHTSCTYIYIYIYIQLPSAFPPPCPVHYHCDPPMTKKWFSVFMFLNDLFLRLLLEPPLRGPEKSHKSSQNLSENVEKLLLGAFLDSFLVPFWHTLATLAPPLAPNVTQGPQDRKRAENVTSLVTPGVPPGGIFWHIFRHFVHVEIVF